MIRSKLYLHKLMIKVLIKINYQEINFKLKEMI